MSTHEHRYEVNQGRGNDEYVACVICHHIVGLRTLMAGWLRAEAAEKERDALLVRIAELEAQALDCPDCGAQLLSGGKVRGGCVACAQSANAAKSQLAELARLAEALCDALPKCTQCSRIATRAFRPGSERFCDEHGVRFLVGPIRDRNAPDYPRAAPLRALQAKLATLDSAAAGETKGGGG